MFKNLLKSSIQRHFDIDIHSILTSISSDDKEKSTKAAKSKRSKAGSTKTNSFCPKKKDDAFKLSNFEHIEQELTAKTQVNKEILLKFIEKVLLIYKQRFEGLLRKQESEIMELKNTYAENLNKELENWEKCMNMVKEQEEKLLDLLQQLREAYNTTAIQNKRLEAIGQMHTDFMQNYETLIKKHKSQASALKNIINKELTKEKNNMLKDFNDMEKRTSVYGKNNSYYGSLF